MSEKSQLQDGDPLADARAWLAHMEQTLARLAASDALEKENERKRLTVDAAKDHDQQLQDRQQLAGEPSLGQS